MPSKGTSQRKTSAAPAAGSARTSSPAISTRSLEEYSEVFERPYRDLFHYLKQNTDDLTEAEFWHRVIPVAEATRLDPVKGQLHVHKRKNNRRGDKDLVLITTIDGYRTIAARTGLYDGKDAPEWVGTDGQWRDFMPDEEPTPIAARVTVYRNGAGRGFTMTVHMREFRTEDDGAGMWEKMPCNQLQKCAEAASLRAAFPNTFDGIYIEDEFPEFMAGRSATRARPSRSAPPRQRPVRERTPAVLNASASSMKALRQAISIYLSSDGDAAQLAAWIGKPASNVSPDSKDPERWLACFDGMTFDQAKVIYDQIAGDLNQRGVAKPPATAKPAQQPASEQSQAAVRQGGSADPPSSSASDEQAQAAVDKTESTSGEQAQGKAQPAADQGQDAPAESTTATEQAAAGSMPERRVEDAAATPEVAIHASPPVKEDAPQPAGAKS